jgi:hypothetical protein
MAHVPSTNGWRYWIVEVLAFLGTPAVIMLPVLEWVPGIPDAVRPWLVVGLVCLGLVGFIFSFVSARRSGRDRKRLDEEVRQANSRLDDVSLGHSLDHISRELFGGGAWRLTVYSKETTKGEDSRLEMLLAASSDLEFKASAMTQIILKPSLFSEIFSTNLADPRDRKPYQSGAFDDDYDEVAWSRWRLSIFGGASALPTADSRMRTRKFAWYATQDPDSEQVVLALAESASVSGINIDFLSAPATSAWLIMAARMAAVASMARLSEDLT